MGGANAVETTRSRHSGTNTSIERVTWRQREADAQRAGDGEMEGSSRRQGDGDINIHKKMNARTL